MSNKIFILLLLCLAFASCSGNKEIRKANRAARLIEKAKRIDPSIIQPDTILLPMSVIVPERSGTLIADVVPRFPEGPELTHPEDLPMVTEINIDPVFLENDTVAIWAQIINNRLVIEYKIKSFTVDTTGKAPVQIIQPVQYKFRPFRWYHNWLLVSGGILWALIILCIAYSFKKLIP